MGKRQEIKNKRQQKVKKQQITVLIIVIGLALLISGFVIYQSIKPVGDIKAVEPRNHPQADGLALGDPTAKIVVEEFSDFQCVACFRFWQNSETEFIEKYVSTGVVYFKYSPFSFIGEESFQASEAAFCANDQGKFWEYHDMLFGNWTGENIGNFNNSRLIAFAKSIGLNEGDFKSCLNSNKYDSEVKQRNVFGNQNNVSATPSFIVNGQLVYSDTLFSTIDGLLAK
ncbi:MAG: DsbA family protein [Anaerolineaceae bacterium]